MNLIGRNSLTRNFARQLFRIEEPKEITVTFLAHKLFKGEGFNRPYIEEAITKSLEEKQPFVSHINQGDGEVEEAILRARNAMRSVE